MKLKGKLILSCAALAAVATTAFSTTYAWYTSNTEVTAKGLKASTATANDSSLQISLDGINDWGASVSLAAITKNLTPVQRTTSYVQATAFDANANYFTREGAGTTADPYKYTSAAVADAAAFAAGTFYTYAQGVDSVYTTQNDNGTTNPVSTTAGNATSSANIVQFDLYFRNITMADTDADSNTLTCPVYIKNATITNQQAGGVATKLLADISTGYTAADYSNYRVDLLRALNVEVVAKDGSAVGADERVEVVKTGENATTWAPELTKLYKLEHYASSDTLTGKTGWDALDYYNQVKGLYGNYELATGAFSASATYYERTGSAGSYVYTVKTLNADTYEASTYYVYNDALANETTAVRPGDQVNPKTDLYDVLNSSASLIGTIKSNKQILKTTWTLYLDGWDEACYDACKGQDVSIDFTFTSSIS